MTCGSQSRRARRDRRILKALACLRAQIDAMAALVRAQQSVHLLPKLTSELVADAFLFFSEITALQRSTYYPPLRAKSAKRFQRPKRA